MPSKKVKTGRKKTREKIDFFGKTVDMPVESFGCPRVEIILNKEAVVDGCYGVLEYYDNFIKLNIGKGTVLFCGANLQIISLDQQVAVIKGKIDNIEYCL